MVEKTFNAGGELPFVFDENWQNFGNLSKEDREFSPVNSEGEAIVSLSSEQKFIFDSQGWLCIPGVLNNTELKEMREFSHQLKDSPESLPPEQRTPIAGPLEKLVDHPVVVGFCNEFLSYHHLDGEEYYGFRFETSFLYHRTVGMGKFGPHNGNGIWRLPGSSHEYRTVPGKAYSGLTRCVWELNEVKEDDGGTLFVNGSHKASYTLPKTILDESSCLWSSYSCPAGSIVFFSEATTHSARAWTNEHVPRIAIFNQYNGIGSRFHWWKPPKELIGKMPTKRQSLFRDAYGEPANTGLSKKNLFNTPLG